MAIGRTWLVAVAVGMTVTVGAGEARAQAGDDVCGDADGNGSVTVTDGVQTLRAAAALSSSCTSARCDVDGSGAVTVTDGVNVLRRAAGLAVTESCPGTSTTAVVKAFLGEMTKIARVQASAAVADLRIRAAAITACDEGFLESEGDTTTFHDCRFGTLVINGRVTSVTVLSDPEHGRFVRRDTYDAYDVRFTDSSFTFRQTGTSELDIDTQAGRLVENGTLTIFTSDSALRQDEYTLTKRDLTIDTATGTVVTGELVSALAAAGLAGIKEVTLGFVVGTAADVEVEFDDGHTAVFRYDLKTNELTQVTGRVRREPIARPRASIARSRASIARPRASITRPRASRVA